MKCPSAGPAWRLAEGKLDKVTGLYEIVIRSIKAHPQWMVVSAACKPGRGK